MKKVLYNLEKELKEKEKKYSNDLTFFDIFIIFISFGLVILKMLNDSQIYFYSNYIYLSLLGSVLACIILCYLLTKRIIFSIWYYISVPVLIVTVSLWIVPKILHFTVLTTKEICIKSTIVDKYWHRYGNAGYIDFSVDHNLNIPEELLSFNELSKISEYHYKRFPKKGSKIKICGDISKVGYTYTHIETIKE